MGLFLALRGMDPSKGRALGSAPAVQASASRSTTPDGLPAAKRMYNLYQPYDPVAYRLVRDNTNTFRVNLCNWLACVICTSPIPLLLTDQSETLSLHSGCLFAKGIQHKLVMQCCCDKISHTGGQQYSVADCRALVNL